MNPILQSGTHPDANTLSAFAEHLLSNDEREQVFAHMAVCSRCREVIFLAQQSAGDEPVTLPVVSSAQEGKARSWWLGGWAWIPTGALAVMIGVAVLLHFRHAETGTQLARNAAPAEAEQQSPVQLAAQAPIEANAPPATVSSPRDIARPKPNMMQPARSARKAEDEKANDALMAVENKPAAQKQLALGQAAPPIVIQPGAAGGSIHGEMRERAQGQSIGGPMANQLQQNAFQQQQNLARQNAIQPQRVYQSGQKLSEAPAAKGPINAGPAPRSASETVTVNALTELEPARLPPTAAPPVQLSYVPMSNKGLGFSSVAAAQVKKAKIALPGGVQALSVASAAERSIAIDTSGALFLSEDHGGHWQPVAIQWTGRALRVRNVQAEKELDTLQTKPAPNFELVNDKLETWTSADGKTWTAKPAPNQ